MAVLGNVFDSLQAMSLLQLLLAFMACIGYALGQGALLGRRARQLAWALALLGAGAFALVSADWTYAAVLLAFAVAGMGLFVVAVWLVGVALGAAAARRSPPPTDVAASEAVSPPSDAVPVRSGRGRAQAHSA